MNYISLPGFAFDSCLKYTKIKLELVHDVDIYTFLEAGIRGGIYQVSKRQSLANNIYLEDYDCNKESNFVFSIDSNSLYGFAQSQLLPVGGFAWLNREEIDKFKIANIPEDSQEGFIFEVDLYYPEFLHSELSNYPLAVEKIRLPLTDLSPNSQKIAHQLGINQTNVEKLIPNLKIKTVTLYIIEISSFIYHWG